MSKDRLHEDRMLSTKAELHALLEARAKAMPKNQHNLPAPGWVDTAKAQSQSDRMRDRRIAYLEDRLERAGEKIERTFEKSADRQAEVANIDRDFGGR